MADRRVSDRRADDLVRQELLTHIEYLRTDVKDGFGGVHSRLDKLNGRVGELEKRESAHHERVKALEEEAKEPHQSKKRTAVTLSLGAGGAVVVLELLKALGKGLAQ